MDVEIGILVTPVEVNRYSSMCIVLLRNIVLGINNRRIIEHCGSLKAIEWIIEMLQLGGN